MSRYSSQPERHVRLRLQSRQIGVELKKNVLRQLLGGGAVCQKMLGNAENHGLMEAHNLREIGFGNVRGIRGSALCHGQGF
jgi:hypothetical protein